MFKYLSTYLRVLMVLLNTRWLKRNKNHVTYVSLNTNVIKVISKYLYKNFKTLRRKYLLSFDASK